MQFQDQSAFGALMNLLAWCSISLEQCAKKHAHNSLHGGDHGNATANDNR